jgi:hypothetical protein
MDSKHSFSECLCKAFKKSENKLNIFLLIKRLINFAFLFN